MAFGIYDMTFNDIPTHFLTFYNIEQTFDNIKLNFPTIIAFTNKFGIMSCYVTLHDMT